jgi:hypothetical protein
LEPQHQHLVLDNKDQVVILVEETLEEKVDLEEDSEDLEMVDSEDLEEMVDSEDLEEMVDSEETVDLVQAQAQMHQAKVHQTVMVDLHLAQTLDLHHQAQVMAHPRALKALLKLQALLEDMEVLEETEVSEAMEEMVDMAMVVRKVEKEDMEDSRTPVMFVDPIQII